MPSAWTVARWTCRCRSCKHARQTPSCRSNPGRSALITLRQRTALPRRPRSCSSRPHWQAWILLWDMASEASLVAMKATFPHVVLPPATKHVVLAALRRGRLPQLQELHPDTGERHPCPLRPRWHLRRLGHEQSMAAPVFGRLCSSRCHGPLRREPGLEHGMASVTRTERRRIPRGRRRGRGTPRPR